MAVIQIAKIQVRRGRAKTSSGIPQLSGGEFGFSTDEQRVYIGSGPVAEGAPEVGNIELLTEKSQLEEFPKYLYETEHNIGTTTRTMQERLDDRVSIRSFGVTGNETPELTADNIQAAINELYINDNKTNIILHFPPGTYEISKTISLPPHTKLIGEGQNQTRIISTASPIFRTINSLPPHSDSETSFDNQPKYIVLANMSIESSYSDNENAVGILLKDCIRSSFYNLKLTGEHEYSGTEKMSTNNSAAIHIETTRHDEIQQTQNMFSMVEVEKFSRGILLENNAVQNIFEHCAFRQLVEGVKLIGNPEYNTIQNSFFNDINYHGLKIDYGRFNISENNRYKDVGETSETVGPTPIIQLSNYTNRSINDFFVQQESEITEPQTQKYYVDRGITTQKYYNELSDSEIQFRLVEPKPGETRTYIIELDYIYEGNDSNKFFSKGTLTIIAAMEGETVYTLQVKNNDDSTNYNNNAPSTPFFASSDVTGIDVVNAELYEITINNSKFSTGKFWYKVNITST